MALWLAGLSTPAVAVLPVIFFFLLKDQGIAVGPIRFSLPKKPSRTTFRIVSPPAT
jgi:hypothetical protein